MKRMFGNGRYANVTATLALIVALGGTSYAAATLPSSSVGSRQLKHRAVTNSKLRANAVTSGKVRNGTLRARDFRAGELPRGPAGATSLVRRRLGSQPVAPGDVGAVTMSCGPGERAVTAGLQGDGIAVTPSIFTITDSFPTTTSTLSGDVPTGWYLEARNTTSTPNQFFGYLTCVQP